MKQCSILSKLYIFLLGVVAVLSYSTITYAEEIDGIEYTGTDSIVITDYTGSKASLDLSEYFPDATEITINKWAFASTTLTSITLPKTVVSIGESAFDTSSIQTITFSPDTESLVLGKNVFKDCANLTALDIPDCVAVIPEGLCYDCTSLLSVSLPVDCSSIGQSAFYDCTSLLSVSIPASCTSVGGGAFSRCKQMQSVTFEEAENSDRILTLGTQVFYDCEALTTISIPEGCTNIPSNAFWSCDSLRSITIPESCTSISDNVFAYCRSLSQINSSNAQEAILPHNCTSIGSTAFQECTSLKNIEIPEACTSIGNKAFAGCTGLNQVVFENANTAIGDNAFPATQKAPNMVIYCINVGSVTIYADNAGISYESGVQLVTITELPSVTEYMYSANSELDLTGLEVKATILSLSTETGYENIDVNLSDCLVSGFDSDQVGEQTITVSYGGKTVTFTVNVYYNLANAMVEIDNMTYDFVRVEPYMTVTGKETGNALIVNKDYVVSYSNNINVGTATATLSGIGAYKGDKIVEFKVLPKAITEANTTVVVADMNYTGSQVRPVPEVACGTEPLILDEDYVVTYGSNINVGKGFVIIEGIGNYDGTIKKWFNINEVTNGENDNSGDNADGGEGGNLETGDNIGENVNNGGDNNTIINNNNTTNNDITNNNTTNNITNNNTVVNNNNTVINNNTSGATEKKPVKGKTYTVKGMKYTVTSSTTVTFMKPVSKNIKTCTIPSTVEISGSLFKVTKINKKACYGYKKLTTVTIGDNVTTIGDQAFEKCTKLKTVTIGKGLTTIGKKAFYKDKNLKKLVIQSEKLKSVGKHAVKGTALVKKKKGGIEAQKQKNKEYKKLFDRSNK